MHIECFDEFRNKNAKGVLLGCYYYVQELCKISIGERENKRQAKQKMK